MKPTLLILLLFTFIVCHSQRPGVAINTDGLHADSSAILDVSSKNKGVLISRMSTIERNAIVKPAIGLMVYDTTINCLCIYSGKRWQQLCENINLQDGLIAYYKFDGNLGDSSGNNLQPSSVGTFTYDTDKNGKSEGALNFDGASNYLLVNDNGVLNVPSVTVSLWFKTNINSRPQELITRQNYSNASNISWVAALASNPGYPDFAAFPPYACGTTPVASASNVLYANQFYEVGKWYHLVATFGNGVQKIYLNGALKNTKRRTFNSLQVCSPSQLIIGSWWNSDKALFDGMMDEVRIYNRVLADTEIEALYVQ